MIKKSFTISEVLITLVIIGIIAAFTIPVILQNHKKTETSAKLKKFYATLSNAVKLTELEWGTSCYEWEDPDDITGSSIYSSNYFGWAAYFNDYYGKHLNYIKIEKITDNQSYYSSIKNYGNWDQQTPIVYFSDGTIMILSGSSDIFFDTNGEKGPNKFGRDIFSFYILDSAPYDSKKSFPNPNLPHVNTFSPGFNGFCSNGKVNINTLIENCKRFGTEPINSETAYCQCSILLEIDGWEFKNDYPFKL